MISNCYYHKTGTYQVHIDNCNLTCHRGVNESVRCLRRSMKQCQHSHEKEGLVTQALITPLTNEIMAKVVPTGLFGRMTFVTIIISENHKRYT